MSDIKFPNIKVKLVGSDGNAFALIGRVTAALRKNNISKEDISLFQNEAMSGDYNHLLATCMSTVSVS